LLGYPVNPVSIEHGNASKVHSSNRYSEIRKKQVMPNVRPTMLIAEFALYLARLRKAILMYSLIMAVFSMGVFAYSLTGFRRRTKGGSTETTLNKYLIFAEAGPDFWHQ
jgi:hypothetical protein